MAQILLLKIDTDGIPVEMNSTTDDITLNSFTVQGGGPVLDGTGLDMNNQDISDVQDLAFNNPATGTINQTAGNLVIDDIMGKERENTMTTSGSVAFPVITDVAGEVDAFRLPALAGTPTASPTNGGEGHLIWDSTNNKLYAWTGAAWDDLSSVSSANAIDDSYTSGGVTANDAVYISAANTVSPADADAASTAQVIGFAKATVAAASPVDVRKVGILSGFSGLTAGSRYYLSGTAGQITATIPVGAGQTIVQVGYAKNTTDLDILIQSLGRRA